MPETVLKAPNYFDREFDLTERTTPVGGVPITIIGAAQKGPAFVPVTVGSYSDFEDKFGPVDPKMAGTYGVQKFLEAKGQEIASVNYIRVLGCGANSSSVDIADTKQFGIVTNAGMLVNWPRTVATTFLSGARQGTVQFLVAKHEVATNEAFGYPDFTNNNSYQVGGVASDQVNLVRAVLFTTSDARFMVLSGAVGSIFDRATFDAGTENYESAKVGTEGLLANKFKLILSSSDGSSFASDDGLAGLKVFTASLDPSSNQYVGKILNTNPENFASKKHLLYLHYPVDNEVAALSASNSTPTVAVLSGSANTNSIDTTWSDAFGYYNARYTAAKSTYFISQPFGNVEYDLFYAEAMDDGEFANSRYKLSISNLLASTNPNTKYGTFSLLVRAFNDSDTDPQVLEVFNNLSLDPNSDNYVIKVVGDKKAVFNFDAVDSSDRGVRVTGRYNNRSRFIRLVPSAQLDAGEVPEKALPFGFRGPRVPLTNTALTDKTGSIALTLSRITGVSASAAGGGAHMSGAIVPPVPFRFTVTRNSLATSGMAGAPGTQTITDGRLYWGVKFERNDNSVLNVNANEEVNQIVENFAKFSGIDALEVLATGSDADTLNNNKFSLGNVALSVTSLASITGSVSQHMREAAYLRNATLDPRSYVATNYSSRITFATLLNSSSATQFNVFSPFAKFTTFMQGGWDGTNIFDKNAAKFTDRSTSTETGDSGYGVANTSYSSPGAVTGTNYTGTGESNSNVVAYRTAVDIATNPSIANCNILAIPGQRDPLVTDYALEKNLEYGLSFYLMDIQQYTSDGTATGRIFDGDASLVPSITQTANAFTNRALDNNAAAAYFPNFSMEDTVNTRRVTVPASIAAISALSYNDRVKFPSWAPAGFDRGSLGFVAQTAVKINQTERNALFDANINPIVKFPGASYVFMSQNTLQQAETALESINVKRMVLDIKRQIVEIGNRLMFDQNTPAARKRFVDEASLVLAAVQTQQGIEKFAVICDERNNTTNDVNSNRLNAQIRVLPTRAIEYVVMDFVVLPSGVLIP